MNKKFGRILCLDYGDKRIGVAVSDFTLSIASPLTVIESHAPFASLAKIIEDYSVFKVVIGIPVTLSGENNGKQLSKVKKFAEKLSNIINVEVEFWDERFSTNAAMRYINEAELSIKKQNKIKDKVAASFILSGYLLSNYK